MALAVDEIATNAINYGLADADPDEEVIGCIFENNAARRSGDCDFRHDVPPEESSNSFSGNSFPNECFDI